MPRLAILACSFLPDTLARCSKTDNICILRAKVLLILFTLANVALASAGVANLILTVSLGFSSVYKRRPDPLGFLPVPTLGSFFFSRHVEVIVICNHHRQLYIVLLTFELFVADHCPNSTTFTTGFNFIK